MLTSYLKITFRNLWKAKGYTAINIIGLAIGMACCLVIFLFVWDELHYDRFHTKADRIYRIVNQLSLDGRQLKMARTPPAYGPALKRTFPAVEQSVRIFEFGSKELVRYADKKFTEPDILLADSSFFDIFSFPLVQGDPIRALQGPNSLVLTQTTAHKYFGSQNPMGKLLTVSENLKFRVTGVMKDIPTQSHLKATMVGSFGALRGIVEPKRLESWGWQQFYTYIVLAKNQSPGPLQSSLPAFLKRNAPTEAHGNDYRLQPMTDIHLRSSDIEYDIAQKGNWQYVYSFAIVAFFTLLIACFNFMNLSTARSARRAKEVGVRKAIGAGPAQLIGQFLGESVLQTGLALLLALLLTLLVLPLINNWAGKSLSLGLVFNLPFMVGLLGMGLLVGLLAGSYPAFVLSAFRPVKVLKGDTSGTGQDAFLRKNLVVVQFVVSTILIIGAGIVFYQMRYIQRKNLGFTKEQLVSLPLLNKGMVQDIMAIKAELLQNPAIVGATACYGVPGGRFAGETIQIPGRKRGFSTNMFIVDHDYIPTMGMTMVAGRNFSTEFGTDIQEGFVVNETAVRELGWGKPANAIGKAIHWEQWIPATPADSIKKGRVIGVVKDFNYKTIHQKIEPLVMQIVPMAYGNLVVRIRPDQASVALDVLQAKWQALAGEWPFDYQFLDVQFANQYRTEQVFSSVFSLFTGLSLFITCLGLLGLASFTAEQRTKEIGVRKVLGASVLSIVGLLSKDFLTLVLIAIVIASPLSWWAMHKWLQGFAYKIDIEWWMFALAGLLAMGIALLTVSFQSVKAALMNPVKSLRSE
ncbi:MAG: hypothetical protein JWP57_2797 [Spirosoma sp.]|nr:hypothetical protein [Spirosoma sp.]